MTGIRELDAVSAGGIMPVNAWQHTAEETRPGSTGPSFQSGFPVFSLRFAGDPASWTDARDLL
ncbi:hypothetical protein ACWENQ_28530 [Nonomuraea sp. NPDC004354]